MFSSRYLSSLASIFTLVAVYAASVAVYAASVAEYAASLHGALAVRLTKVSVRSRAILRLKGPSGNPTLGDDDQSGLDEGEPVALHR